MDARALVVADAEAAELIQPRKGALDDPAPPPRPLPCAVRRIASRGTTCRARRPHRMAAAS